MRQVVLLVALSVVAQDKPVVVEGMVVDAISKSPLQNVAVAVRYTKPPDGSGMLSGLNIQGAVAMTGEDGKFRIEESKTVPFRLYCQLEGFVNKSDTRVFELKRGEAVTGVTISLDSEAQVSGRVVDGETDKPLAGFSVSAFRRFTIPEKSAKTDDEGRYMLKGLPPGEYQILVATSDRPQVRLIEPGHTQDQLAYPTRWFPGVAEPSGALSVQVSAGARLNGYDFKLRRLPVLLVRGTVELPDANGPIAFTASRRTPMGIMHQTVGQIERPGRFEILNLPPGSYIIQVHNLTRQPGARRHASSRIDLVDRAIEDVHLVLLPGVRVTGEVRTFGLKDSRNDPLWSEKRDPTMKLGLRPNGRASFMGEIPQPVGPDGRFALDGVSIEAWSLLASDLPPGHAIRSLIYNGVEVSPQYFELNPGAMSHHLDVLIGPVTNSVTGRVTRGDKPVANAHVVGVLESQIAPGRVPTYLPAEADSVGQYALATISPGVYRILAFAEKEEYFNIWNRFVAGEGVRIEVGESTNVVQDIVLR